jgi:hypothetical protein
MEKIKAVAVVLLCHALGLAFMFTVHVGWGLTCLTVLSIGAAKALTTCNRPTTFEWVHFEYVGPESPSEEKTASEAPVAIKDKEAHEPVQV